VVVSGKNGTKMEQVFHPKKKEYPKGKPGLCTPTEVTYDSWQVFDFTTMVTDEQ
jgi:hypothetical protein